MTSYWSKYESKLKSWRKVSKRNLENVRKFNKWELASCCLELESLLMTLCLIMKQILMTIDFFSYFLWAFLVTFHFPIVILGTERIWFPQLRMLNWKNVLQLLYIIAHEKIVSNSVSEYTHVPWKVSGACRLLMSCISEQEHAKNMTGFLIGMNGNSLF